MSTKMTWKDLMRELMERSTAASSPGERSDTAPLGDDDIQDVVEDIVRQMGLSDLGPDEPIIGEVIAIDLNDLGPDFDELSDEDKLLRFESLLNHEGRLNDLMDALREGDGVEVETITHQATSRIADLMEADGLIEPRDVVQKALAKRAAIDPLSVVPGPKTLQ